MTGPEWTGPESTGSEAGRYPRLARHVVGVAAAVAGADLAATGFEHPLPVALGRWLLAAAAAVGLDASIGLAVALAAGIVARRWRVDRGIGLQVGLAAGVLVAALTAPRIAQLRVEGQWIGVAVLAAVTVALAVAAGLNARFWVRREVGLTDGDEPVVARPFPVVTLGFVVAGLGAAIGGFASGREPTPTVATGHVVGGPHPGPSVVVITVDGLGADAVPPALVALTDGGVRFTDAVSPTPDPRAANASVLVGLHPLRHGILTRTDRLSRGYETVFEVLRASGRPTGAFVSSSAVAAWSGLDQGFDRYDDDGSWLGRTSIGSWFTPPWVRPGA
ncbi:MAG: hypothetical protein ABMB14_38035, partial [Myxococcota bacterium]